jgi:hypothetical protein
LPYNRDMALSWGKRRKFLYTTVVAVIGFFALVWGYSAFFTAAPTCFDGSQNGSERGVDCGGTCSLVCKQDARAPVVLWARTFEVAPNIYTAAAYIQNPNIGSGAKHVAYTFQLFDDKNLLVSERQGTIDIPPVQTVPFVAPNINVGNRTVSRVIFGFSSNPVWQRTAELPKLHAGNQNLSPDASQLTATIYNDSNFDATKVVVAAVLFDESGTARAASRTIVDRIARKDAQDVVFTWPNGVPGIVRAEINILPSF